MRRVNPVDDLPCSKSSSPIRVEQKCTARAGLRQRLPKELSAGLNPEDPELYQGGCHERLFFRRSVRCEKQTHERENRWQRTVKSPRRHTQGEADIVDEPTVGWTAQWGRLSQAGDQGDLWAGAGTRDSRRHFSSDKIAAAEFFNPLDVVCRLQKFVDVVTLFFGPSVQQAEIAGLERFPSFRPGP